jgi:hypothetical protein
MARVLGDELTRQQRGSEPRAADSCGEGGVRWQQPQRPSDWRPSSDIGLFASGGTIEGNGQVQTEMARQGGAHDPPDRRITDELGLAANLERRHAAQVDGSKLVAQDNRILRLAGLASGNGDLGWVPWGARRNWTHGRKAASVKRFIRHDQSSADAGLLVTDRRIEIDEDDRPAEPIAHSGHASASR